MASAAQRGAARPELPGERPRWTVWVLPAVVLLLIGLGWLVLLEHETDERDTVTAAYQETQLEIVRGAARSLANYATMTLAQPASAQAADFERNVFDWFITPIHLLQSGDAWVYAPDRVVFDASSASPEVYPGQTLAQVFALQAQHGAAHFEDVVQAASQGREGVGWYVWQPATGPEITAWTPVQVGSSVWIVGMATPLSEIMDATSATLDQRADTVGLSVVTLGGLGLSFVLARSNLRRQTAEHALHLSFAELEQRVTARTAELVQTNAQLQAEGAERQRAESGLRRQALALENMFDALVLTGPDGLITDWNPAAARLFGYSRAEALGRSPDLVHRPQDLPELQQRINAELAAHGRWAGTVDFVRRDGGQGVCEVVVAALRDEAGAFIGAVGVSRDVTQRQKAEAELRQSLREVEVLLREVHHRVKNNLQVMASLLSLQAEFISDPAAQAAFRESQERVRSMALVHEELYQSRSLAAIDFAAYLERLAASLFQAYALGQTVKLQLDLAPLSLPVDVAIPCGLIVNELVSNALKYAFPNGRPGVITIQLAPAAPLNGSGGPLNGNGAPAWRLCVADNGAGLPPNLDFRHTESLGLQLVNLLAGQLKARLELETSQGVAVSLTFAPAGQPSKAHV